MNEERIARMRELLEHELEPSELRIEDDSHRHIGHAEAQDGRGHFTVHITSARFTDANRIERHRMVYAALGDMLRTDIHALRIDASAPPNESP